MKRNSNFVEYPGTGMWMICNRSNDGSMYLFRSLATKEITDLVRNGDYRVFWIDTGMGAANLLKVRLGGTSASATEITPRILNLYVKR